MAIGMFAMVGIAVSILTVSGINHKYFKKRYSTVQDFYTEEERYRFNRKFAVAIAAGVCLILFGLCLNMGLELLEDPVLEEAGGGIQLFFVAAAVWIFIYFGVQRAKYEVGEYNKKKPRRAGQRCETDRKDLRCDHAVSHGNFLLFWTGLGYVPYCMGSFPHWRPSVRCRQRDMG